MNRPEITTTNGDIAQPLGMRCEYQFCQETKGKDYIDPNRKGVWKDEPVFLCDKHAELLKLK